MKPSKQYSIISTTMGGTLNRTETYSNQDSSTRIVTAIDLGQHEMAQLIEEVGAEEHQPDKENTMEAWIEDKLKQLGAI